MPSAAAGSGGDRRNCLTTREGLDLPSVATRSLAHSAATGRVVARLPIQTRTLILSHGVTSKTRLLLASPRWHVKGISARGTAWEHAPRSERSCSLVRRPSQGAVGETRSTLRGGHHGLAERKRLP